MLIFEFRGYGNSYVLELKNEDVCISLLMRFIHKFQENIAMQWGNLTFCNVSNVHKML
jgi:hypothetical protein